MEAADCALRIKQAAAAACCTAPVRGALTEALVGAEWAGEGVAKAAAGCGQETGALRRATGLPALAQGQA